MKIKPNLVFTSEASIASERGKRSLRKSSKPSIELCHPSAVFASKAQSEQIKQIKNVSCERSELRQPSAVFANQLKQASQALSTLAKRANQASYARLHSRLRPPSHTGRRSHAGYACSYDCTDIYRCSHTGYVCTYYSTDIYRRRLAGYASYLRLYRNLSS